MSSPLSAPRTRGDALDAVFAGRRAILFDLDGTLYGGPTAAAFLAAVDRISGMRVRHLIGIEDPIAAFAALDAMRGPGTTFASKSDVLERRFGISVAEMNRFREWHTRPQDFLVPDARLAALLQALAATRTLVLGTNNSPALARTLLATLGVDAGVFRMIQSSEDARCAKPEPAFFHRILKALSLPAETVVSVGDREDSDLAPARALGMGTWHVTDRADLFALEELIPGAGHTMKVVR